MIAEMKFNNKVLNSFGNYLQYKMSHCLTTRLKHG